MAILDNSSRQKHVVLLILPVFIKFKGPNKIPKQKSTYINIYIYVRTYILVNMIIYIKKLFFLSLYASRMAAGQFGPRGSFITEINLYKKTYTNEIFNKPIVFFGHPI